MHFAPCTRERSRARERTRARVCMAARGGGNESAASRYYPDVTSPDFLSVHKLRHPVASCAHLRCSFPHMSIEAGEKQLNSTRRGLHICAKPAWDLFLPHTDALALRARGSVNNITASLEERECGFSGLHGVCF